MRVNVGLLLGGGQGFFVIGDLAKNKLVKWWFLKDVGMCIFFKLVKWLFQPLKVGDLVILLNCGDGDMGSFRVFLSRVVDIQFQFKKKENID